MEITEEVLDKIEEKLEEQTKKIYAIETIGGAYIQLKLLSDLFNILNDEQSIKNYYNLNELKNNQENNDMSTISIESIYPDYLIINIDGKEFRIHKREFNTILYELGESKLLICHPQIY